MSDKPSHELDVPAIESVREAACRPMQKSSPRFWAAITVLGLIVLLGVIAYALQLVRGLDSAGYNDQAFWGIYEANLVAFIGVSYGGALVSAILRLTKASRRAPITRIAESMALFALVVGMVFAVVHLGRPERMWRLITDAQISSPVVWDFVAIMSYLAATLCFLYLPLIPDLALVRDRIQPSGKVRGWLYDKLSCDWNGLPGQRAALYRATTIISIIIIPLAVVVHSVLSRAFAVTTRPGWNSTIFGPYFVVAALYSGIGMVILVVYAFRAGYDLDQFITPRHFQRLAYLMLTLGLVYLYFTFTEMLTEGYKATEDLTPLLESLLIGDFAPYFWLFVAVAGVIPILIIALPWTRTVPGIVLASTLVVAGMWLKRLLIIVPPATNPLIEGPWGDFRLTPISVVMTIAGAAAIPLMLMLFFKFVPILDVHEMEELSAIERQLTAEPAVPTDSELVVGGVAS